MRTEGKIFPIREFLKEVKLIRTEFHITPVKRSNDTSRRRIAILIRDEFLRLGGNVDQAFFLEENLYGTLKNRHLSCNPTPEEIRIRELPRGKNAKTKGFDPLKLVSENFEPKGKDSYPLVQAIIEILSKEEEKDGLSGNNLRGGTPQTSEHLQKDTRLFTKQARSSLYRAD